MSIVLKSNEYLWKLYKLAKVITNTYLQNKDRVYVDLASIRVPLGSTLQK